MSGLGRTELADLWARLRLEPGHLVMCHSSLFTLGRVDGGPEAVVQTLLDQLGPGGGVVVPTFTYSFFRSEVYDPLTTPSRVGQLGDVVRTWPGAVRTAEPNFSVAGVGAAASRALVAATDRPFLGPGGLLDTIDHDLRFLLIGVDFTSLAYFMHLEVMLGVPYRHEKRFTGKVSLDGRVQTAEAVHFVRDDRLRPVTDRRRVGRRLDQRPECRQERLGRSVHRYLPAAAVRAVVAASLSEDPNYLLNEDAPFEEAV